MFYDARINNYVHFFVEDSMILVDFNGLLYQNIYGAISASECTAEDDDKYNVNDFINIAKGFILSALFDIQNEYQSHYGNTVICLDKTHNGNWRTRYLPTYKTSRAENRKESKVPFDEVFDNISIFLEQLKDNTPYKVVSVDTAEADDVILCLAKQYAKTEDILIISSDKDMIQAQKHGNVKQFSPLTKQWITPETKGGDMDFWIHEHVILGDTADEVPRITDRTEFSIPFENYLMVNNIKHTPRTYNNLTLEEQEQIESNYQIYDRWGRKDIWKHPRLGSAKIQKILNEGKLDEFLDSNELYRENYERNKRLVLDEYIPSDIYEKSMENYVKAKTDVHTSEFVSYLNNNGLSLLALNLPPNFYSGDVSDLC